MSLSEICIKRPVFASVLSLVLIVFGLMGFFNLETRFFPKIEPHYISVNANYQGASAKTMEESITTPLENAISNVSGIEEMISSSSQGNSWIQIKLSPNADPSQVTDEVRNQVEEAKFELPSDMDTPRVTSEGGGNQLLFLSFVDSKQTPFEIYDYLQNYILPKLQEVPGTANAEIVGSQPLAIRVTLNPERMAALNISTEDIENALTQNNVTVPIGEIEGKDLYFPLTATTTLTTVDQYRNLVIKQDQGKFVHLSDVAYITPGEDGDQHFTANLNGQRMVGINIDSQSGANPIDVADKIDVLLKQIKPQLPSSMQMEPVFEIAPYLKASVHEVYWGLCFAILCVVLVCYLFLGSFRAVLIPIATVPVCLMGAFGMMYVLGLSINMITLLALILAVGLVVDDAIVMLENIHRHIERGESPLQASINGSKEILIPVIAMTISLAAVYTPIGFMHDRTAIIFRQFAFTLSSAVLLSGFVALTLTPMMCGHLLNSNTQKTNAYSAWIFKQFSRSAKLYRRVLARLFNWRKTLCFILLLFLTLGIFVFEHMPRTFMPTEDVGYLQGSINMPTNASMNYSLSVMSQVAHIIKQSRAVDSIASFIGQWGNEMFIRLIPFDKRKQTAQQLSSQINNQLMGIPGFSAFVTPLSFFNNNNSQTASQALSFQIITSNTYENLYQTVQQLTQALNKSKMLKNVNGDMNFNSQQYEVNVDRNLVAELGLNVQQVDDALQLFLGGKDVSYFNQGGERHGVFVQADAAHLSSLNGLNQFYLKNTNNQMVPLANVVKINPVIAQQTLPHYDRLRSASVGAELPPGVSLGEAVNYLQKILPQILPNDTKFVFTGDAETMLETNQSSALIFILGVVFIYLVLAAQFESFIDPFIILLGVPLCIVGALTCLWLTKGSLNIYTQIGLVTLVGLIAKHGILITQFANQLRKEGLPIKEAVLQAASLRLRPILMTTSAMVMGAMPLLFATGASANSRFELGVTIAGGLVLGTFFSLVVVPMAYSVFVNFRRKN